jgi:hypothetical protein
MGTKFKEVNTLSFIGNIGPRTERVWKEVDEEADIIGCKEKAERPCRLVAPLGLLTKDLPGDNDTKQIPIFVNDDVRIELMHCRSLKGEDGRRPAGFCETQIQVQNKRVTQTSEGDFELDEGDVLVVPASMSHVNRGDGPTTRLIVYTRAPVQIAQTYPVKQSVVPNKQCTLLKPKTVLDQVQEGGSGGKHFELVENADLMVETTHRSDAQRIGPRTETLATWRRSGSSFTRENRCDWPTNMSSAPNAPDSGSYNAVGLWHD